MVKLFLISARYADMGIEPFYHQPQLREEPMRQCNTTGALYSCVKPGISTRTRYWRRHPPRARAELPYMRREVNEDLKCTRSSHRK